MVICKMMYDQTMQQKFFILSQEHRQDIYGFIRSADSLSKQINFLEKNFTEKFGVLDRSVTEKLDSLNQNFTRKLGSLDERVDGLTEKFHSLDESVDGLTEKVNGLNKRVNGLDKRVTEKLDGLDKRVTEKFDGLDKRVTEKFDGLDKRIDGLDKRIDSLDKRVTEKFDSLDKRVDGLTEKVDGLTEKVNCIIEVLRDLCGGVGLFKQTLVHVDQKCNRHYNLWRSSSFSIQGIPDIIPLANESGEMPESHNLAPFTSVNEVKALDPTLLDQYLHFYGLPMTGSLEIRQFTLLKHLGAVTLIL